MVAKLTVIFLVILCFLVGLALILLPWFETRAYGAWGDNYLLALVTEKAGLPGLRTAVTSYWFRGAVTGLGILNLFIAFWEMAHFNENVARLEGRSSSNLESRTERGRRERR